MTTEEFELKPCPFCGAAGKLEEEADHHGEFYNLGCSNEKCMAHHMVYTETPEEMPVEAAVATWNRRPDFTAGRALGRREMKGEARGIAKDHDFPDHVDCDGCITARLIASAIEAYPDYAGE